MNLGIINKSFETQAADFESKNYNFTKKEYLEHIIENMQLQKRDSVLEVAAGTCACGREMASHVKQIICLDATAAMLEIGKKEAEEAGLHNISFVKGYAEELPFLDHSFDVVVSRLAFHHFTSVKMPFAEMARVLKPGGKLILIDMESASEELRRKEDKIETLRDASHVKNLSIEEMKQLFAGNHLSITLCEKVKMPTVLENWMELTKTPEVMREKIRLLMKEDISGGEQTGFAPYLKENKIYFDQRWVMLIGCEINEF
ncbi:class I SAM-dependent methyltransferase [Clostridium sp. JNZ X4-2]